MAESAIWIKFMRKIRQKLAKIAEFWGWGRLVFVPPCLGSVPVRHYNIELKYIDRERKEVVKLFNHNFN